MIRKTFAFVSLLGCMGVLMLSVCAYDGNVPHLRTAIRENVAMRKGGVGIIARQVYVVTMTDQNKIILGDDRGSTTWFGLPAAKHQVVFVFKGKVFEQNNLPEDFRLADAILISFEGPAIRFVDFGDNEAGYYDRSSN